MRNFFHKYFCVKPAGLHRDPSYVFTEDYQSDLLRQNHFAFDRARKEGGVLLGEMVWNFADFNTKQVKKKTPFSQIQLFFV